MTADPRPSGATSLSSCTPLAWVVMPTYNEAPNIVAILRATVAQLDEVAPGGYRILVVDDNSPDGTGKLADQLAEELPQLEVLHRPGKDGLGHAYLAGFTRALAEGASWSWRWMPTSPTTPGTCPSCLEAAREPTSCSARATSTEAGCATGVCSGGSSAAGGCLYARLILRTRVRDLTGGFKCIRREVLEAIDLEQRPCRGLRIPDRGDVPRARRRLSRPRDPDRFSRPDSGNEQDVGAHRDRGDAVGTGAAPPCPGRGRAGHRPLAGRRRPNSTRLLT